MTRQELLRLIALGLQADAHNNGRDLPDGQALVEAGAVLMCYHLGPQPEPVQ